MESHSASPDEDINIVEIWLSRDSIRWTAGIIGGLLAAALAILFAGVLASSHGWEFTFPIKLLGIPLNGYTATESGPHGALLSGLVILAFIGGLWGFVFGHFVRTHTLVGMIGMGFTWGAFSWVFVWNLFLQAFKPIHWNYVPTSSAFFVCMVYGFALSFSVAAIDRILRGNR